MFLGRSFTFLAALAVASVGSFSPDTKFIITSKKAKKKNFGLTPQLSSSRHASRLFQQYGDVPYEQSNERSERRRNFADLGRRDDGGGRNDRYYEDRTDDRRRAPRYEPQDDERYRSQSRSRSDYDMENERRSRREEEERYSNSGESRYTDRYGGEDRRSEYYQQQRPGQQGQRYDERRYEDRDMDRRERGGYGYSQQEGRGRGRGRGYGQDGEDRYDQRSEKYGRREGQQRRRYAEYNDRYDLDGSTNRRQGREYDEGRYGDGYDSDSMGSRERSYNRDYTDDRRAYDYREPRGELMRRPRDDDRYNPEYYSIYDRRGGDLARRRRYSEDPYLPIPRFGPSPFFSSMFDPFASLDAMMDRMMGPMTRRASRLQFQMNDMARDDAGDLIDEALDILDRDRTVRSMMRSGDPPIRLASSNRAIFSRSSSMALVDGVQKELLKIGARLNYPWTMWLVAENGKLKSLVVIDENDREIDVPVMNRGDRDDDVIDAEVLYD